MASNVIELLIKAQDLASDKLKRVESASSQLNNAIAPLKTGMLLAGTAIVAAGAASIKMAGDLEQSLNVFQSVSGATAAQMAIVSQRARELGKDASLPGISAKDAAAAMTELAKAGLSVNDTLAASKGVLSLAKAGQLEVADAAQITAQALNAFKLSGTDATKVADALSAGANASAADVGSMALGLQQSAAVANQFGVSLNDTVTTLALFANRGIQGSDAGTSLKTMLIALANPSKQAAELMGKMGLKAYDASGQFVGMRQLAINLKDSMKGLTQEQQNAALATIFGTDAFRAASFLADSAGKSYDDMSKQIGKVGAATDLAKAQNSGFKGALDNLKSTLETLGTDIGTKLLPPLTEFLKKLASSGVFDFVANNINLIVIALGTLFTMIAVAKFIVFANNVATATKALMAATKATTLFNLVLSLNPIILIVLAVIALIGILVALQVKFNIFGKLFKWLADVGGAAWNWIKDTASAAADWIVKKWQAFDGFMRGIWAAIMVPVQAVADFITGVWNTIYNAATVAFSAIYNYAIKPIIDIIVGYIKIQFAIWEYIMQWVIALATYAWNFIYNNIIKPVIDLIVAVVNQLVQWISVAWDAIVAAATAAWNWIWTTIIKPVIDAIVAAANWLGGVLSGVWNWIKDTASAAWGIIAGFAQRVWDGWVNIFNAAVGWFTGVWNGISNALAGPADAIKNMFSGAMEGVKNIVIGAINWVIDRINGVINSVNHIADKVPGAPHLGNIGRLAGGTPNWAGGLTMVGERGPELIDLPQGSAVMGATQTRQVLGKTNNTGVVIEKIEVNNNVDIGRVAREIAWQMATRG